jgi:hypothetical protein
MVTLSSSGSAALESIAVNAANTPDPFPDPRNISTPALADRSANIGIALNYIANTPPEFFTSPAVELGTENVVTQLTNGNVRFLRLTASM